MQTSDVGTDTASATPLSAEEIEKQRRKLSRSKFLGKIRNSLGSVKHQLAFSPAEAGLVCGKSATWAYRKVYDGTFRVTNDAGRLLIPRSEIERYLAGAEKYNPEPKDAKNGGGHDLGSL
jgi:hypothetical protein